MISSKVISAGAAAAVALMLGLGISSVSAEEPAAPAAEQAEPASETPEAAAPDDANAESAAEDPAKPATEEAAEPAQAEGDTAAAGVHIAADQLKVGEAVFGSDGEKIGELNRVTSSASGSVEEIRVTVGGEAGLNAKVFAVPADKIADVNDGIRLSLSADEARKLPIID